MGYITCECCSTSFSPLEDPEPDGLLVDPVSEEPVVVQLDSALCWACRNPELRPMAHLFRHAGVE